MPTTWRTDTCSLCGSSIRFVPILSISVTVTASVSVDMSLDEYILCDYACTSSDALPLRPLTSVVYFPGDERPQSTDSPLDQTATRLPRHFLEQSVCLSQVKSFKRLTAENCAKATYHVELRVSSPGTTSMSFSHMSHVLLLLVFPPSPLFVCGVVWWILFVYANAGTQMCGTSRATPSRSLSKTTRRRWPPSWPASSSTPPRYLPSSPPSPEGSEVRAPSMDSISDLQWFRPSARSLCICAACALQSELLFS